MFEVFECSPLNYKNKIKFMEKWRNLLWENGRRTNVVFMFYINPLLHSIDQCFSAGSQVGNGPGNKMFRG